MPVIARKTRGFCGAFISDPHIGQGLHSDKMAAILRWIANHDPKPLFLVVGGDLTVGEHLAQTSGNNLLNFLYNPEEEVNFPTDIKVLPVIGNHDTKHSINSSGGLFQPGDTPHEYVKSQWPNYFENGNEWYYRDFHSVRVMVMCNNVDTTGNNYHNCNPPGYKGSGVRNPDYSGFATSGSDQWNWAMDTLDSFQGTWCIGAWHRPVYSPFPDEINAGSEIRPTQNITRTGIVREMINRGLSIILQGDQHINFVGKKYISDWNDATTSGINVVSDTGVGAWPIITSTGYFTRSTNLNYLPGQTKGTHYLYESGGVNFMAGGCIINFEGDHAYLEFAINKTGNDEDTMLVYSGTIYKNPGLPSLGA